MKSIVRAWPDSGVRHGDGEKRLTGGNGGKAFKKECECEKIEKSDKGDYRIATY